MAKKSGGLLLCGWLGGRRRRRSGSLGGTTGGDVPGLLAVEANHIVRREGTTFRSRSRRGRRSRLTLLEGRLLGSRLVGGRHSLGHLLALPS